MWGFGAGSLPEAFSRVTHGFGGWVYLAFLVWMLVYCVRNDPERHIWLWVILIFQPFGALIYFLARWLPSSSLQPPRFLHNLFRGREIERKRIAASQIGNAHQYVELADALRDIGRLDAASDAYQRALDKDPRHMGGLWGAACVDFRRENFQAAKEKLEQVLAVDSNYKFGDVSLLYGNVLLKLNQSDDARAHLEQHTRRWRHPEALFRLAEIRIRDGDPGSARNLLQSLIMDVDGSPRAIARRFYFWKGRARRLLRKLPPA